LRDCPSLGGHDNSEFSALGFLDGGSLGIEGVQFSGEGLEAFGFGFGVFEPRALRPEILEYFRDSGFDPKPSL